MDEATSKWRQAGKVSVWQYVDNPKNYCGRHFTADTSGCEALLHLIERMQDAVYTAEQTFELTATTGERTKIAGYPGRHRSYRRLILSHSKLKYEPSHWRLTADADVLTLEVGASRLNELRLGIEDVRRGNGDYCIGEDGMELWFW